MQASEMARARVLIVGCGNSRLSENMFDDGFSDVTSIDYSEVVVRTMTETVTSKKPALKYVVMDARELKFPDESFDVIIDKGTLDSVLCGEETVRNSATMLAEIHRVLKPGRLTDRR